MDLDTTIQKGRNEGKVVGLVMTDMSAAFNLIDKSILLPLLKAYGFGYKARSLVNSYLTDRKTKCKIQNEISETITLDSGVGEGSVLGPVFFIMGMCSVSIVAKRTAAEMAKRGHWVDTWTLEFADDTSGIIVADTEEILQDAVNIMSNLFAEYFNAMGMCLNQKKSELIVFRSKKKVNTITLPSGQEESKVVRLLGLWIDNQYKFEAHTQKVLQKVRFKLSNLSNVRPYLSQDRAKLIMESLIHSTINYMAIIYLRLPSNQKKVQRLLSKAARLVLQADPMSHVEDIMNELYWLNVPNMYRYALLTSFRRLKDHQCHAWVSFKNLFYAQPNLYKLRSAHSRVQWTKITSHGRNSYIYQSSWLYNDMELNGEYFKDWEHFKSQVKFRVFKKNHNGNIYRETTFCRHYDFAVILNCWKSET